MSYKDQKAWKQIQAFLPEEWRLTEETLPEEEYWDWEGHRVHLDTYRNPEAPAKVILFHGVGTNGRQMTTILGRPLAEEDYEAIAIDMPTYADYVPKMEPEDFDVCPIMLAQPEDDRWTPQRLAELTLDKIHKVPVRREVLRQGSHYPIERTALEDLRRYVLEFLSDNLQ